MKRNALRATALWLVALALLVACGDRKDPVKINPAFSNYIAAFSSGLISSESAIVIKLNDPIGPTDIDLEDLFDFDPGIDGEVVVKDNRTLEFIPDERLPSGEVINGSFDIGKLMLMPEGMETFEFQFQVTKQDFLVRITDMSPYDQQNFQYIQVKGNVLTSDVINLDELEQTFSFYQDDDKFAPTWTSDESRKHHEFVIDSVLRGDAQTQFLIEWDASDLDLEIEGQEEQVIPAINDFTLIKSEVIQHPKQFLRLVFSDPLNASQTLKGMIKIGRYDDFDYNVENNEVKVYPKKRFSGWQTVQLFSGIENSLGYKTQETVSRSVHFEDIKPAVKFLGDGVILPQSGNLEIPFEAVNLNAVDLRVIQIYEDNVAQFLQVNQLDGENELKRVGRLVFREKIDLLTENPIDRGKWNTFSVNLSEKMATEPGAIYRVQLSFRKGYSLYPCSDEGGDEEETEIQEDWDYSMDSESSYWDGAENYWSYDPWNYGNDYNWSERDNPCSPSYYGGKRTASRNFLASDIGLIVKRGSGKKLNVYAVDINTTEPLSGVELELVNYQQQGVANARTAAEGKAEMELSGKPFLLVASRGDQRGYLRLDDGSSLSLSKFDVAGTKVQKGLKGFVYGERGVWRPGDSLYLTCMIENNLEPLPENHPVILEMYNPRGQMHRRLVKNKGVNGVYSFRTRTEDDAPTGMWRAVVKVGGASFTKNLRIEDIKPNRLKINLAFDTEILTSNSGNVMSGKLSSKWLHGAPASGLKAIVEAGIKQGVTKFDRYAEYEFQDPVRKYYSDSREIFTGALSQEGSTEVNFELEEAYEAPGMLKVQFTTRVFEKGGAYSIDNYSIPYSPFPHYVGIKTPKGDAARACCSPIPIIRWK
ncbi:hypothetical protein KFE98_05005 [bacterium SCSIO 12741]|nr:hypothetical protein KFE98_05005 [bacterium SCSIO 12741]